ncbi:YceI family protein [bacterium]|nr:YceI family protein [bacterium]
MKTIRLLLLLGLIFGGLTTTGNAQPADQPAATEPAASETFNVDPVHTSILFRIKHLDTAYFYGWFEDYSGSIVLDHETPANSSVEFEIQVASIETRNDQRNAHLMSPDFFDVEKFATITFKSTSVEAVSKSEFKVTGDLTLHGVTKSITLTIEKTGEGLTPMGYRLGGLAEFSLNRTDFGMTNMVGPVGDQVDVTVSVEAIRKSD